MSCAPPPVSGLYSLPVAVGQFPVGDDALDWEGDGFGQTRSTASDATGDVVLTVRRAGPDNPAPICVLTDRLIARVMLSGGVEELGIESPMDPPVPVARGER